MHKEEEAIIKQIREEQSQPATSGKSLNPQTRLNSLVNDFFSGKIETHFAPSKSC